MPGPSSSGDAPPDLPRDLPDLPPDLPPEYAEAYLRGFERAYNERTGEIPAPPPPVDARREHATADSWHRLVVPAILVALALCLILTSYGLGRLLSSEVAGADASSREPADGVAIGGGSEGSDGADASGASEDPEQKPYDGEVGPAQIEGADASCTSAPSIDAAGNEVTYDVANVYDGDQSTAWRCDGSGEGQEITLDLPDRTGVVEVGLIPGYAKTDPVDGADRYAENNRITRVRWVFADETGGRGGTGETGGVVITQKLDGSTSNRSMQTVAIPETEASSVTIEILRSTAGSRSDTVAIGEVAIGGAAG